MNFKQGINENQEFLFPKKPSDFLPENHLAKLVYSIVNQLDITKIQNKYSNKGQHAYDPKMMINLLFYGYCTGIRSSRKIAKACEDRFDFVYLASNLKPSHDRISDFRKDNLNELKELFVQIVLIGCNLGLAEVGNIKTSIDGSKVRANASAKLTKDEEGLNKLLNKTKEEINEILKEAEQTDKDEDEKYGSKNRGDELPVKLQSKISRESAIIKACEILKKQKQEKKDKIKSEKKRKPTKSELEKIEKMKINITDNEAKFMKQRNGVIKPNYNVQISVDEKKQFILSNEVTDECNDHHQLIPVLEQIQSNIGEQPKQVKADNGYHAQLVEATKSYPKIDFYIDDKNRRIKDLDLKKIKEKYDEISYNNLIKLLSDEGAREYKKRMHTVEPVFGNIKHNIGYRYFLLRGLSKVSGEFNLMCIAHNLKKIASFSVKAKVKIGSMVENFEKMIVIEMNCGHMAGC